MERSRLRRGARIRYTLILGELAREGRINPSASPKFELTFYQRPLMPLM
jgi:hypothetical protein